jgi:hypothetical protein
MKGVEGTEKFYVFRSADDGSNSFCCLGEDRILLNIVKVDVGRDIKARHLSLSYFSVIDRVSICV